MPLEHFRASLNHENALAFNFVAVPDGKPLHTFPGTALGAAGVSRRALALAAALTLCGCTSSRDHLYEQYFQVVKQSFAASFGGQRVSREEAAAIPYASLGYRLDGGPQYLLVLGSDAGGDLLWTAKSQVVIVTRQGRIVRTVGLPHDISAVTPQPSQLLAAPYAALRGALPAARVADFPDIPAYGVALSCTAAPAGPQTISILGNAIPTVRVRESCHSAQLHWSFVDSYWIEPQTGLVWRSVQHLHPGGETVEIETLRPPG